MNYLKNVSTGTIIRTISLAVALLNQILAVFGISPLPFESEEFTHFISTAITMVTALLAWWKNNSFTKNAISADAYLSKLNKSNSN